MNSVLNTKLVGILNITPDSFSDGGQYDSVAATLQAVEQMIIDGVDIVDIGAESTRPGATPLSHDEEWGRLSPILVPLIECCHDAHKLVSIDTRHPQTTAKALALGADWINDVSGFENSAMIDVVKDSNCKLVLMHSLTIPADPNITLDENIDIISQLTDYFNHRYDQLKNHGISRDRIIFDPGIGFNKTHEQSIEILSRTTELKELGAEILIGHSRKSFFSCITDLNSNERDNITIAASSYLVSQSTDYLRVHNIKAHRDMIQLMKALHA